MNLISSNAKTGISILNTMPGVSCDPACPLGGKCYDIHLMKIRPVVRVHRAAAHDMIENHGNEYVKGVCGQIARKRRVPEAIRLLAGGDYIPSMLPILKRILESFPNQVFYMISKRIRHFPGHARQLLSFDNFRLVISEARGCIFEDNVFSGNTWRRLRKYSKVRTAYTLMPDEPISPFVIRADIVFNVSKKAADINYYRALGLNLCPCDAKDIPLKGACAACGRCYGK